MISLPPLWVCTGVAGLIGGAYAMDVWQDAQRAKALEESARAARSLQRGANQAGARYADMQFEQQETARTNAEKWRKARAQLQNDLDSCRVDAELVGLLDDAGTLPAAPGDPAEPRPPAARAEAPPGASSCAAELDACRSNYADVCVPNAQHVRGLLDFARGLIRDYNRATGRD